MRVRAYIILHITDFNAKQLQWGWRRLIEEELCVEPKEATVFVRQTPQTLRVNPPLNPTKLAYTYMVIAPIGFIKNVGVLKPLGGLILHVLGKLRLLTTLHYSVPDALGDIQTMVETMTRENYRENNIQRTTNTFDANRPDENRIVQVLEESYSLHSY